MRMLANQLSMALGRPVIDKTELIGTFDVTLQWAPDTTLAANGPSIFAALQEQLGLRLDADKAPVEVFIVESANKTPVEN